jgi:glyceraldehyde-3-phosphate dehydrogenase (NADP+)
VGGKRDPDTDVGPLIDEQEAIRIKRWVDEARDGGAVACTGSRREGAVYWPTVLTNVPAQARLMTEEVFGPVVSVHAFDTLDETVTRANATPYGLQAGVFTRDLDRAVTVAGRLRVEAVMVNDSSDFRIDAIPFGGPKRSGVGREGIRSTPVPVSAAHGSHRTLVSSNAGLDRGGTTQRGPRGRMVVV